MPSKKGLVPRYRTVLSTGFLAILALGACIPSTNLEPAPDIRFSLYQGQGVLGATDLSLSDLRGKPAVLNFWYGLCPPCRVEMPDLQEFHQEYGDRINLVGLDMGPFLGLSSRQDGIDLLEELNITYPTGHPPDDKSETAGVKKAIEEYEIMGYPSTFFITANGKIFRKWTGILNKEKLVNIAREMLGS